MTEEHDQIKLAEPVATAQPENAQNADRSEKSGKAENIEKSEPKYHVRPEIDYTIHYDERKVDFEIILPGVEKKNIDLKIYPTGLHIVAPRGEVLYESGVEFGFDVVPEKTTAKYNNGLLEVQTFLRDPMETAVTLEL